MLFSRIAIQTPFVIRVRELRIRDREVHVRPVNTALMEWPVREDLVLRPPILPNQSAKIAKPSAAAELPERRLAKQQVDRSVFSRWCGQLRHRGHAEIAQRLRR